MLDASALARVREWSLDSGRLVVDASVTLAAGDVVVGGVGPNTPTGLLRRVTSVATQGDTLVAETTQASLADVIAEGSIDLSIGLQKAGIASTTPSAPGVTPQNLGAPGGSRLRLEDNGPTLPDQLVLGLNDVVLADADGDPNTTDDQVRMSGSIGVEPTVSIVFHASLSGIQEASVALVLKGVLTYDVRGPYGDAFDKSVTLATYAFAPIVIDVGFPLVFVPTLLVNVRATGELAVALEAQGTVHVEGRAGVGYKNGSFGPIVEGSATHENTQTVVAGKAQAKLEAGPDLAVLLYGVAGPFASLHGYAKVTGDPTQDPCYTLSAGYEARAGIDLSAISVLGLSLPKFETPPAGQDFVITQGACDPTSQGLNPAGKSFAFTVTDAPPGTLAVADAAPLPDGGWIVAASGAGSTFLLRVRPDGSLQWQKGFTSTFAVAGVALAKDGRVLLGGHHVLSPWVAKVDLDGNLLWSKTYLPIVSSIHGFARTAGGLSVLVGETSAPAPKYYDDVALAVDDDGAPVWGAQYDDGTSLKEARTAPGGLVVMGDVTVSGNNAGHVMLLGEDGSVKWNRHYSGAVTYLFSIDTLPDGSFITGGLGTTVTPFVRIDGQDGHVTSSRLLYDPASEYTEHTFHKVRVAPGGNAYLAGAVGIGDDALLVSVGPDDVVRFASSYGGPKGDVFSGLVPLADGMFVLADTASFGGLTSVLALRTSATGDVNINGAVRTALTLAFDKPGAPRAGGSGKTLPTLIDAAGPVNRTNITFTVDPNGDAFAPDSEMLSYTKR